MTAYAEVRPVDVPIAIRAQAEHCLFQLAAAVGLEPPALRYYRETAGRPDVEVDGWGWMSRDGKTISVTLDRHERPPYLPPAAIADVVAHELAHCVEQRIAANGHTAIPHPSGQGEIAPEAKTPGPCTRLAAAVDAVRPNGMWWRSLAPYVRRTAAEHAQDDAFFSRQFAAVTEAARQGAAEAKAGRVMAAQDRDRLHAAMGAMQALHRRTCDTIPCPTGYP